MRRLPAVLVAVAAAALVLVAAPALAATPSLHLSPGSGLAGQAVHVFGSGCPGGSAVTIRFDGATIATDRALRHGKVQARITIPQNAGAGHHEVTVKCGGTHLGPAAFQVKGGKAKFNVHPRSAKPGDVIHVSGRGCAIHSTFTITFDSTPIESGPTHQGSFATGITIPRSATEGAHTVSGSCSRPLGSVAVRVRSAYPPRHHGMTVSRTSVPAGQTVTLVNADCPDQAPVATLDGHRVTLAVSRSATGMVATATIPRDTVPGLHQLRADCDAGPAGAAELQVLDPAGTTATAASQPPARRSAAAVGIAMVAGMVLLLAGFRVGRRRTAR